MINAIFGIKQEQKQKFLENGIRIPVTEIKVEGNSIIMLKNKDKHGYNSIQIGLGINKKPTKAESGNIKGANLKVAPRFLRELRVDDLSGANIGEAIKPSSVFSPGDIIDVIGISKGKGFAGGVKRHHFKGGPRTHGQSDRERAPGSIGQTTTPGRVYKGKRMAGRMGHERVTVKNLKVIEVSDDILLIKGLVPGSVNSLLEIKKVGKDKKFVPLFTEQKPKEEVKNEEVKEDAK